MENAAEALKMAAAVLVFVTALAVAISSFTLARQTADLLIAYTDRDTVTQYTFDTGVKTRLVGVETIIPTVWRAYNENYKIFFYESTGNAIPLYEKREAGGNVTVYCIDEEVDSMGGTNAGQQEDNFIMALLYGDKGTYKASDGNEMTFGQFSNWLKENKHINLLNSDGIYGTILGEGTYKCIEEYGVYYQSDAEGTGESDSDISGEFNDSIVADVNKSAKRVISYTVQ